ncbi:hypothetical protein IEQ34_015506 [Dendrobium chrysotoxum]|uniref:Uncharacterized protein n=1 Tax=Dendrobium chrysotoxum TaxID=161865 RepID=A0AAV7G0V3_DENCH|nr:hypothetical protein IEQ34_015506 [Dendrobium chrysotoxum]
MSIIMRLIVFFRDRGVVLTPKCLSRMGRLTCDTQGRIIFRSKWLDIHTRDPSKNWNLLKKYEKLKDLSIFLGIEDILKILNLLDIDTIHYEASSKKKRVEEILIYIGNCHNSSPSKLHIPEDILKHQCVGRQRADELLLQCMDLNIELIKALNDWNKEFVKVKYFQGEYNRKYDDKIKEMKTVE